MTREQLQSYAEAYGFRVTANPGGGWDIALATGRHWTTADTMQEAALMIKWAPLLSRRIREETSAWGTA